LTVRLKDIAEKAGVSILTVSRVINDDKSRPVSQETKEKVWRLVKEMGYQRKNAFKYNGGKHFQKIGLILNDLPQVYDHPFYNLVIKGIEMELKDKGYSLSFSYTQKELNNPARLHRLLSDEEADGIIILAELINPDIYKEIKENFQNVVFVDNRQEDIQGDMVYIDREKAAYQAVKYLISQGHTEIAFVGAALLGSGESKLEDEDRFKGYQRALLEAGLPLREEWIKDDHWDLDGGYNKMKELLKLENLPTAIFGASDLMSIGAMRAIQEEGYQIPEDFSIVSYDDIKMAAYTNPPLTTVSVPKKEIGKMAVKLLLQRINGELNLPVKVELPTELILRESVQTKSRTFL